MGGGDAEGDRGGSSALLAHRGHARRRNWVPSDPPPPPAAPPSSRPLCLEALRRVLPTENALFLPRPPDWAILAAQGARESGQLGAQGPASGSEGPGSPRHHFE